METYHEIMLSTIRKRDITAKSFMKEGDTSKKSVLSMLLELIKDERADLVILASQRRSGLQKLTEGSLTEDLIKIGIQVILMLLHKKKLNLDS